MHYSIPYACGQPRMKGRSILQPLLALFIGSATTSAIISMTLTTPKLTPFGPFLYLTAYATASTILAALVAGFLLSQEQFLVLWRIDDRLLLAVETSNLLDIDESWSTVCACGSRFNRPWVGCFGMAGQSENLETHHYLSSSAA